VSKDELVSAYVQGRISRRMFVRGLIAAGVSVTAAIAYSQSLSAKGAPPPRRLIPGYGDQYGGQYDANPAPAAAVTAVPRTTG
jgi:hypothetical protein